VTDVILFVFNETTIFYSLHISVSAQYGNICKFLNNKKITVSAFPREEIDEDRQGAGGYTA